MLNLAIIIATIIICAIIGLSSVDQFLKICIWTSPVILLILAGIFGLTMYTKKKEDGSDEEKERLPIAFTVPANHVRVFRWIWGTSPGEPLFGIHSEETELVRINRQREASGEDKYLFFDPIIEELRREINQKSLANGNGEYDFTAIAEQFREIRRPKGYIILKEGLKFWIPGLMIDEGLVDLSSRTIDLKEINVNDRDKQPLCIDTQYVSRITDPKRYIINVVGKTKAEKEAKRLEIEKTFMHTAANKVASNYISEEVLALQIEHYKYDYDDVTWDSLVEQFGPIKKDNNDDELVYEPIPLGKNIKSMLKLLYMHELFGISFGQIGIQRTYAAAEIEAALARKRAAEIEESSAENEANAIETIIRKTGANPTLTTIAMFLGDMFRARTQKNNNRSDNNE